MLFIFSLIFIYTSIYFVNCSHLNSVVFSVKPVKDNNDGTIDVEFTVKIAYTRDWTGLPSTNCDQTTIKNKGSIGPIENINCQIGCFVSGEKIGTNQVFCTAFSIINNWSQGENKFITTIPKTNNYEASWVGGAWRGLSLGGGSWEVRITVDSTTRSDTGEMNITPITYVPPVLQLRAGSNKYVLKIPTYDADNDVVKCRWASSALGECGGVCATIPFATLDPLNCTITFDLTGITSSAWYAVALQVEDFNSTTSTTPFSSVPAQFLVSIDSSGSSQQGCLKKLRPLISEESCVAIMPNTTFQTQSVATATCSKGSIQEIQVIGPFGLLSSQAIKVTGSTNQWFSNISWTPDNSNTGANLICTVAFDDNQMSSPLSCFTIIVGYASPKLQNSTSSPTGLLSSATLLGSNKKTQFQISFDIPVSRPIKNALIKIHSSNGSVIAQFNANNASEVTFDNSTIKFNVPNYTFPPDNYYVTFGQGVGLGYKAKPSFCSPESNAETDQTFWTFIVPNSNLLLSGKSGQCIDILYNQQYTDQFPASISYPGVNYVNNLTISGPIGSIYGSLIQSSNYTWYKNFAWTPSISNVGKLYSISAFATDNLNQYSTLSYNVSVTTEISDPDIKSGSGWPSNVLTETFLGGRNGFMTFQISFKSKVSRPTISPTYLYIYSSNGIEYTRLDCSVSGFVYYIDDFMYFDIPVDTFPSQNYYVLFDEGVGVGSNLCHSKSFAITDKTFWTFTVPSNYTGLQITTTKKASSLCNSIVVDVSEYTKCNISSFIFLCFLLFFLFFFLHLLILILLARRYLFPKRKSLKINTIHVHPYYFKLHVPSSYKFNPK